jgi:hypothetical protein
VIKNNKMAFFRLIIIPLTFLWANQEALCKEPTSVDLQADQELFVDLEQEIAQLNLDDSSSYEDDLKNIIEDLKKETFEENQNRGQLLWSKRVHTFNDQYRNIKINFDVGVTQRDVGDAISSAVSLVPDAMLASKLKQERFDFLVDDISKNYVELIELLNGNRIKKVSFFNKLFGNEKCPLRIYLDKNHRITSLNPFNSKTIGPNLLRTSAQELITYFKGGEDPLVKMWGGPSNIVYKKDNSGKYQRYGTNTPFGPEAFNIKSNSRENRVLSPFTVFRIATFILQPLGLGSGILQESLSFSDLDWAVQIAATKWLTPRVSSLHKKMFKKSENSNNVARKIVKYIIIFSATSGKIFLTNLMIRDYDQALETLWKDFVDKNRGEFLEILKQHKEISKSHNLSRIENSKKRILDFVKKAHGENSMVSKYQLLNAIPAARQRMLYTKQGIMIASFLSAGACLLYKFNT